MGGEANWGAIIAIAIVCLVGYFGSAVMCNKVAKEKGLDLTGGFLKKIPMVASGFGVCILMSAIFMGDEEMLLFEMGVAMNVLIGLAVFLAGAGILFLTNKKAGDMGIVITLSIFQAMSGLLMLIVFIFKLIGLGFGIQFGTTKKVTTQMDYERNVQKHGAYTIDSATEQQKDEAAKDMGYTDSKAVEKVIKGEE